MKNVAATSGQSVSLATTFLVEENDWEETCAGSDTVLNFFLSSSYKRSSLSRFCKASARFEEYKVCTCTQEENARNRKKLAPANRPSGQTFAATAARHSSRQPAKSSPNRAHASCESGMAAVLAESLGLRVLHSIDSFSFFFLGGFIRMPFRPELFLFLLTLTSPITLGQQPAPPRPVSVDDLFGVREVHDPQISPDGRLIAYTVSSTSLKEDKNQTRIWMIPAGGGDAIPLTAEDANSDHPRWSPEGNLLAFLSSRKDADGNEGKGQIYLLSRQGGEAQRLTDTVQDVEDFVWAPDGKRLVLILRDPSPEELEAVSSKGKDSESSDKSTPAKKSKARHPWVIDRLYFKEDTVGYLDRRRKHLYVFDIT